MSLAVNVKTRHFCSYLQFLVLLKIKRIMKERKGGFINEPHTIADKVLTYERGNLLQDSLIYSHNLGACTSLIC